MQLTKTGSGEGMGMPPGGNTRTLVGTPDEHGLEMLAFGRELDQVTDVAGILERTDVVASHIDEALSDATRLAQAAGFTALADMNSEKPTQN